MNAKPGRRARRAAKAVNAVFALVAVLLTVTPLLAFLSHHYVGWPDFTPFSKRLEKRNPNPFPELAGRPAKEWGHGVEEWYNDRFAWRTQAVEGYRRLHLEVLKTQVGREVPGEDGWFFRHGGDWAELDDFLGGFELTEEEKANWLTLFEGRRAWAAAHGIVYLQFITSVKAQIQCEKLPPRIRRRRGVGVGRQIREALKGTTLEKNVLFVNDVFRSEVEKGRDVFYPLNHHPNGIGEFLLYEKLNERIREFFPEVGPIRLGRGGDSLPECWITAKDQLAVAYPGERNVDDPVLIAEQSRKPYPLKSVVTDRPGDGLYILMMNDSFMRYTLSSWREEEGNVHFPFGRGIDHVASFIFLRATTGFMDTVISERLPDIIIEQFPECRLNLGIVGFDETMKNAAAFARGRRIGEEEASGLRDGKLCVCAILEEVVADDGTKTILTHDDFPAVRVSLGRGEAEWTHSFAYPGIKRAVFFEPVDAASVRGAGGPISVRLGKGRCARLELRFSVLGETAGRAE